MRLFTITGGCFGIGFTGKTHTKSLTLFWSDCSDNRRYARTAGDIHFFGPFRWSNTYD